ncbi:MAG: phosphoribosyltransferase [bacterium]
MNSSAEHIEGRRVFLVTQDVPQKLESFNTIGIKTPPVDDDFYFRLHKDLIASVQVAMGPDVEVRSFRMSDLANEVLSSAYQAHQTTGSLIVSTCHEFADPMKGVTLDINRLVDRDGKSLGIGPRPGAVSLTEQLEIIKSHAAGRSVVIVEDGIFSGTTVEYIVDKCRKAGIDVNRVIVGFRFASSQEKIDSLTEQGVEVSWVEEFGDLIDWVPDHDFLPMVPNCGRILGVNPFGEPVPYYSLEGAAYSMPYVFPFSPVEDWASIPEKAKRNLAKTCLSLSGMIYTKLNLMNKRDIRVDEVLAAPQPVTIPMRIGSKQTPRYSGQTVSEYINTLSHSVSTDLYA